MDLAAIIILISLGIVLLTIEIVFVPGTTIFGIVGFVLIIIGVIVTYNVYGSTWGSIMAFATFLLGLGVLFWALRAKPWNKFSLKSVNEGRTNDESYFELEIGSKGETISSLRPQGKAEISGKIYQVRTDGEFISSNTRIIVSKIRNNSIFVTEEKEK